MLIGWTMPSPPNPWLPSFWKPRLSCCSATSVRLSLLFLRKKQRAAGNVDLLLRSLLEALSPIDALLKEHARATPGPAVQQKPR